MNRPAELPLSTAVLCTWTGQPCSIAPALVELVNVASNIAGCQHIIYGWAVRQSGNLEPDLKTLDLTLAGATSIPSTSMLDLAVWQVEYDRQLAQVLPQRRNAIPLDESPGHLLARMAWAMAQISRGRSRL
ncbi:hypothetical protein [Nocardia sp. alder85J]|uniref:hypothetical protein n=1 Tax=Nocardia sp. alder85J TaxID=2862949 RepID=UPI002258BEFE|nr:hypothetical protein [Nocardia sp. alder85J]MCX4097603.1 hypothetical protein [Nocardia sp. alder85J]